MILVGSLLTLGGMAAGVAIGMVEDLNFHAAVERHPHRGDVIGPHEHARIATGIEVAPFEFQGEVLVHTIRTQLSRGLACAMKEAVTHGPGGGGGVDGHPARKINPIEKGAETIWGMA